MRFKFLLGLVFAALSFPVPAAIATEATTELVEFYNQSLDHYFITLGPKEIQDLDAGVHPGWVRTGYRFLVVKNGDSQEGSVPVCRFYGRPEAGLDSHFYSAKASECQDVKDKFAYAWQIETEEAFRAFLVDPYTGKCPADTVPVFRLWNQRPDVNHRFTDQLTVFQAMLGLAYKAEGDGNPSQPVAFCAPAGGSVVPQAPAGTPSCTITGTTATPLVGSTLTLDAICTGTPTSYAWVGCSSTSSQCKVSQATPGAAGYAVTASNAAGTGSGVTLNVTWQAAGGALPLCTISGSTSTPTVGGVLGLTANCSQSPTSYQWLNCNYLVQEICIVIPSCSPSQKTCSVTSGQTGFARYAVAGVNGAGAVGPRAAFDAEWKSGGGGGGTTPPPPGNVPSCTVYASNSGPVAGESIVLSASCSGSPTNYSWVGVACSAIQCSTSSSVTGPKTFTVTASNALGSSSPASITVEWQSSPAPVCSLSTNNPTPTIGQTITINSSCTGSPTGYAWNGCTGSDASCTDAATVAGAKSYALSASNGNGLGPQAGLVVNWQTPPTAAPVCSVTASNQSPFVGQSVTLSASCSNSPTSYAWTNCNSSSSTCVATSAAEGAQTYSVIASNGIGPSAPAQTGVNWQASVGGSDFCGSYRGVNRISKSWGDSSPIYTPKHGGFDAEGVVVVSFTAPATPASYGSPGSTVVAEYQGPPTFRQVTISRSACDFRPSDPSGANGPYTVGNGSSVTITWNVGNGNAPLTPGETYFVNVRNWSIDNEANLCTTGSCEAIIQMNWPG